jgi:predicted nucleic acid-binding protein
LALTYLADTSVLTRLGNPAVASVVAPLLLEGAVGRSRVSDLELGFSARSAVEWDLLSNANSSTEVLDVRDLDIVRSLSVQRMLADAGLRGRKIPDLIIAASAEQRGLVVLHYDADFDHISRVTGQATQWVCPRGSID